MGLATTDSVPPNENRPCGAANQVRSPTMTLLEWRRHQRMTLAELASLAGISASTASEIERGLSVPTFETAERIWLVTEILSGVGVSMAEHLAAFRASHPRDVARIRAEARNAVRNFKRAKEKEGNGKTRKRSRPEKGCGKEGQG